MSLVEKSYFYNANGDPILMDSKTLISTFVALIGSLLAINTLYNPLKAPNMASSVFPKYDANVLEQML